MGEVLKLEVGLSCVRLLSIFNCVMSASLYDFGEMDGVACVSVQVDGGSSVIVGVLMNKFILSLITLLPTCQSQFLSLPLILFSFVAVAWCPVAG